MRIGKWSLPNKELSTFHVHCGARLAEQNVISILVNVLRVEKCVADPSFRQIRLDASSTSSTFSPLEFEYAEPQIVLHALISPPKISGLSNCLINCRISEEANS